jgi:hypothetical protein
MARSRIPTTEDFLRLDAIAKHLKVRSRFPDPRFTQDVIKACLARVAPVIDKLLPCTGEQIALGLSQHLCVKFEEVRGGDDIDQIKKRYLMGKKEIGFAQLDDELERPGVDALLFQRMNAEDGDCDRWVAVLNLQDSDARAYWNRFHEIIHRVAEPPQGILPLHRHQFDAKNPVESLIDAAAAEIAFYGPAFRPIVLGYALSSVLNFDVIDGIREEYAPSASLLSTLNVVVRHWPTPAAALTAEIRGRLYSPGTDRALRIMPQGYSDHASKIGLTLIPNMRVPLDSPIVETFQTGVSKSAVEHLGNWKTSEGKRLARVDVHTSARRVGERVYALLAA